MHACTLSLFSFVMRDSTGQQPYAIFLVSNHSDDI